MLPCCSGGFEAPAVAGLRTSTSEGPWPASAPQPASWWSRCEAVHGRASRPGEWRGGLGALVSGDAALLLRGFRGSGRGRPPHLNQRGAVAGLRTSTSLLVVEV